MSLEFDPAQFLDHCRHERIIPARASLRAGNEASITAPLSQRCANHIHAHFSTDPAKFVDPHAAAKRQWALRDDLAVVQAFVHAVQRHLQVLVLAVINRPQTRIESAIMLWIAAVQVDDSVRTNLDDRPRQPGRAKDNDDLGLYSPQAVDGIGIVGRSDFQRLGELLD